MRFGFACLVVVLVLLVSPRLGLLQETVPPAQGLKPQQLVEFNFTNSDIEKVLRHVIQLTGWSVFYDPERVQGKVTILTPGKIPLEQAIRLLQGVVGSAAQTIQVLVPGSQQAVPLATLAAEAYSPHARRDPIVYRNSDARGPLSRPYDCNCGQAQAYPLLPYRLDVIVDTTR
jgi:type II secretory pathway component GspD/PulD (secretin)